MKRFRLNAGFSIIEMMVAIVIGLFLLGGAISMLVTSKRTYTVQDDLARIQENARFAMEFIARDMRMAGYFGCAHNITEVFNHVNSASAGDVFDTRFPVEGFEQGAVAWLPSGNNNNPGIVAGTDAMTVRYLEPSNIFVTNSMPQPSAVLQITPNNGLEQGDIVAVSDCASADIFQISGPNGNGPSTNGMAVHNTGAGTAPGNNSTAFPSCPGAASNCFSKAYDVDARILRLNTFRYYVGNDAAGNPALFRAALQLDPVTRTVSQQPIQLIDGVEHMQVQWGVDTTGNQVPDTYLDADGAAGGVNLANPDDWTNVIAVRVWLLLRSVDPIGTDTDARTYQVGDQVLGPFNDRRRRRVFATTVFMRNLPNLVR